MEDCKTPRMGPWKARLDEAGNPHREVGNPACFRRREDVKKEPITVKPHLSVEAVEMRYCKAKDPVERSQMICHWLLAQGKSSSSRLWRNRPRMGVNGLVAK